MATSYNTSLTNVVIQYLQKLNVNITEKGLSDKLEQHPYFPSLYSINNTLDRLQIPNEAFALEAHHLDELQAPFLAYFKNQATGKDFILVTSVTSDTVSYISNNKKEKKVSRQKFLEDWEKIVLVAEPNGQSGEPQYLENLKKEQANKNRKQWLWSAAITIILLTVMGSLIGLDQTALSFAAFLSVTKLLGSVIAILLLAYEIDRSNFFVKSLCSAGKQTNCDAVLNSKASDIAGIKWSEAGFFYFAASAIFLFYPSLTFSEKIPWLAIGATVVSPYILFSLYYQYKVVKEWCPLCLAAQAVLFLELTWAVLIYWKAPAWPVFNAAMRINILTSILLPVTTWFVIKPLLKNKKAAATYQSAYKRLLYNPEYFDLLLKQQQQAPDGWQQLGITLGNPNAANTILKVCNPYCAPCGKAHHELEEIIHQNKDFNLRVIFTATTKPDDRAGKPVRHLLAIAANNNAALTQSALDDWYTADKKDYDLFAGKYPMNGELKLQDEKIEAMNMWCREAGITATPTIFINGRLLPQDYNVMELKNIL